jgi:cell division protein ZapE
LKLPKLTNEDINEAKRFTLFIDEIYENKVALIITAKTKISEIYNNGIGSEAFKRTASRLQEIKSDNYWQASKINFNSHLEIF